jgi:hypothetical protein
MPAGQNAVDRAVGSAVTLRRLNAVDFEDIEHVWKSCLFVRGQLYLEKATRSVVMSLGFRWRHAWGVVVLDAGEIGDGPWQLSSKCTEKESRDRVKELQIVKFARPFDTGVTAEEYEAIPTSPGQFVISDTSPILLLLRGGHSVFS